MLKKTLFVLLFATVYIGSALASVTAELKRDMDRAFSLLEHGRYGDARHSLSRLRESISIDDEVQLRQLPPERHSGRNEAHQGKRCKGGDLRAFA